MFRTKVVEKIKTHILCSIFPPENRAVYEIMWKNCGTARQTTDDNIIRRMRITCCITKTTDTHSKYVISFALPCNNGYANASQYYVYTYIACLVRSVFFRV
jgi:hypothetical protein